MKFIKKNKLIFTFIVIFLIIFIVGFIVIRGILYPNNGKSAYGDRLEGIENYKISDEIINNIKKDLVSGSVKEVTYRLQGKIINFEFKLLDGTGLEDAKAVASKVLDYFDDSYKSYYDIQIYLTSETMEDSLDDEGNIISKSVYPIMGYKHKNSNSFVWTVE